MDYETIRCELTDHIFTITLNRPDKLNVVSAQLVYELVAALEAADADDEVRAVIVTGAGRAFCAGADLSRGSESFIAPEIPAPSGSLGSVDYSGEARREQNGNLAMTLYDLKKPVIGAINGAAVGLGATMILPMDIRLAAEGARFGFVFARRGMVLEMSASFFLPRIVGISTAVEWCMTGRLVTADEALRLGLVSAVVPQAELLAEANRLAREIADNCAPVSVSLVRQMLWKGLDMAHPMEAHSIENRAMYARARSKDAGEGVKSFLEKRPPDFLERVSRDMPELYPWWEKSKYF